MPLAMKHGVPDAAVGRPRLLELGRPLAHRQHAGAQDVEDGPLLLGADVGLRDRDHACRLRRRGHAAPVIDPVARPQAGTPPPPDPSAANGAPVASARRWPHAQTQPMRRAGLPATSALSGTLRVTTAPAPTVANRPDVVAGDDDRAGADRGAVRRRIGLTVQSSARASRPSAVIDRGNRSLVRIALGPMNTPSSDGHAVVDQRRVLDLHPIADDDSLVDERVATDDAVGADLCAGPDLCSVPDARPGPTDTPASMSAVLVDPR